MDREYHRLAAVDRFVELDPIIANDLNDIVKLAAQICNVPVAIVTLLGEDKQWFKTAVGTEVLETPRELSFCEYTIQQNDVLIVPDLSEDERYNNNPLVIGDPNVRFYAGAPLSTKDGHAIGSLCVVDFHKRDLNEDQRIALKTLSKQAINLMELNWSLTVMAKQNEEQEKQKKLIEDSEIKLKAVFNSTSDLHVLVGKQMEILAFNKPASAYIYNIYYQKIGIGDKIVDYIDPRLKKIFTKCFKTALKGKLIKHELLLRTGTSLVCWREIKLVPIKNNEGAIIGVAINSADITKRKQQEKRIHIQTEALTRIAMLQSHELRRPVASLLGLMDLMKMEKISFGYFNILEVTVNELDERIRIIVQDSEDTMRTEMAIVA